MSELKSLENVAVTEAHYTLSSDKNGFSLQRLVAMVEKLVAIGYFGYCVGNLCLYVCCTIHTCTYVLQGQL